MTYQHITGKTWSTAALLAMLTILACRRAPDFPNRIYITQAGTKPEAEMVLNNGAGTTVLTASTAYQVPGGMSAEFVVADAGYLETYNAANETDYLPVPAEAVSITPATAQIAPGGAISTEARVTVKEWPGFNEAKRYAVPVKLTNMSNGMPLVDGSNIVLIRLKKVVSGYVALAGSNGFQIGDSILGPGTKDKPAGTFTVEGRFKLVDRFDVAGNWRSDIFVGLGLQFLVNSSGDINVRFPDASFINPGKKASLRTWYHFAMVYSNNIVSVYLDGELIASQTYAGLTAWGCSMGAYAAGTGLRISEFKIWSAARTKKQLLDNVCVTDPTTPGLLGYWRFNEGTGKESKNLARTGSDAKSSGNITWEAGVRCPE